MVTFINNLINIFKYSIFTIYNFYIAIVEINYNIAIFNLKHEFNVMFISEELLWFVLIQEESILEKTQIQESYNMIWVT